MEYRRALEFKVKHGKKYLKEIVEKDVNDPRIERLGKAIDLTVEMIREIA